MFIKMHPRDRVDWLKWAFQRGYCEDSYQAFNESKFMTVIDSYRDTDGAIEMINGAIAVSYTHLTLPTILRV